MRLHGIVVGFGLLAGCAVAQEDAGLHVAFVGDAADGVRTTQFAKFLAVRFAQVTVVSRDDAKPVNLQRCDVVLLDWDQDTGVSRWMSDRAIVPRSPLGPRDEWKTPTVLLGSAGLNMAVVWDVRGGVG